MPDRHWYTKKKWERFRGLQSKRRYNTVCRSTRIHPKLRNLPNAKINYFEPGKWYTEWYAELFGIKVFSTNNLTGYTMRTKYTKSPYRL